MQPLDKQTIKRQLHAEEMQSNKAVKKNKFARLAQNIKRRLHRNKNHKKLAVPLLQQTIIPWLTATLWSILAIALTAALSTLFTKLGISWYSSMQKPIFHPPNWVFGLVWSIFYAALGVAFAYTIYNHDKKGIVLFAVNFALQVLWCFFFFTLQIPFLGFVMLLTLEFVTILLLMHLISKNNVTFYIVAVYLIWVTFALVLNYAVVMLN